MPFIKLISYFSIIKMLNEISFRSFILFKTLPMPGYYLITRSLHLICVRTLIHYYHHQKNHRSYQNSKSYVARAIIRNSAPTKVKNILEGRLLLLCGNLTIEKSKASFLSYSLVKISLSLILISRSKNECSM